MERRGHAHRGKVRYAMAAGSHVEKLGQVRDLSQVADAAGMNHRRTDVVDELFLDELLAVVNRIEDLTHGERRRGVLADDPEALLQLCRHGILQPEQVGRLECLPQPHSLDRREPVMRVVQEV